MPIESVIYGPPGTGKTRALEDVIAAELRRPWGSSATVGYATYAVDAARDAQARIGASTGTTPDDWPWVRTLHSMCARLLGSSRYADAELRDLVHDRGYDVTGDDSRLLETYQWYRGQCLDTTTQVHYAPHVYPEVTWRHFATTYEGAKRELGCLDYTDVLVLVLEHGLSPPVQTLLVDEAQDLDPLQIALIESWARTIRVVVAGDDDQAIYEWRGATPQWLVGLAQRPGCQVHTLGQSYRVPSSVHALAQALIERNLLRVRKRYAPRDVVGRVSYAETCTPDRPCLWLARCAYLLDEAEERLRMGYIPYTRRDKDTGVPVSGHPIRAAIAAGVAIRDGGPITYSQLADLLEYVPASSFARGTKARAGREVTAGRGHVEAVDVDASLIRDDIRAVGPVNILARVPAERRHYLALLWRRHGMIPAPTCTLSTIHAAKGREADHVVLDTRITGKIERSINLGGDEAERRVWYVGLTRARETLTLLHGTERETCYDVACM